MAGDVPCGYESEADWRRRLLLVPLPLGRALRDTYRGLGPALARQLVAEIDDRDVPDSDRGSPSLGLLERPVTELQPSQWRDLRLQWQRWLDAVERERFGLWWGGGSDYRCWNGGETPGAPAQGASTDPLAINRGLAAYYGERKAQRRLEQRRQGLGQRLQAAMAREERTITRQQAALDAVAGSEKLQGHADALLSQPSPSRQQIDEAQKLYRQARKLRRSEGAITPRLELHRQRQAWMETSLTFLEQADSPDQLKALEEELRQELPDVLPSGSGPGQGPMANRAQRRQAAGGALSPQPLELRTAGGLQLQVGRNHRQNEWISLRQARRGDLWFHAQECPGSHVVLKGSEQPPGEGDLRAAADLAAHFSRARGNTRVPVVMVPAEELQRIPGAAAGTVRHRGGEILWGEPDRARLLLEPSYALEGGPP
jgi:predicted ribosome quality control (RQC) complex YloA/Tae2 family protein